MLARFHAVARHAPSAVATDGVVQSVPRSIIDSWEAKAMHMQRRKGASEHEKAAVSSSAPSAAVADSVAPGVRRRR